MQNDFQKTEAAFSMLDDALERAEKIAEKKHEQLRVRQSNADQRLNVSLRANEQLKLKAAEIAVNVEKVINNLDEVLGEDVSGNNNN